MTEGPEATFLATYISRRFKHKNLTGISIQGGRYKTHGSPSGFSQVQRKLPLKLLDVVKKGKVLFFLFESGWTLMAKLGMTGWFSTPADEPIFDSNPNIVFHFEHEDLEFFDFRNFGTLQFTQDGDFIQSEAARIAPDILDSKPAEVLTRIQNLNLAKTKPKLPIAEALMDQTLLFSGIGNILKSELLYDAKIPPKRLVGSLDSDEWRRIVLSARKMARRVLHRLENKGLELDTYFSMHKVYQQKKDPQGLPVVSYKSSDGRTTFWVPQVQR